MAKIESEWINIRRLARVPVASLLAALSISACSGGSEPPGPSAGPPQDAETIEAAAQVAAAGGDAALAVTATSATRLHRDESLRIRQVIVFGDSLSDVGTYRVGAIAQVGGGKFTTNPGPVWSETVGVSQQPGIGCNPDATGACTAALTIPVAQQVTDYLAANNDRFNRNQLVFLLAGANDILFQLGVFQAKVAGGMPVEQASGEALSAIGAVALELAGQVQRIVGKGATRVVVLNVPDISDTPFGNAPPVAPVRPLIAGMVQVFNAALAAGLHGTGAVLLDYRAEFARVIENPGAYHVHEINLPACDAAKIAAITNGLEQGGSSLFCSRQTLVQNGAAIFYLFADSVHPTTLGHLITARFVLVEVWKRGLL